MSDRSAEGAVALLDVPVATHLDLLLGEDPSADAVIGLDELRREVPSAWSIAAVAQIDPDTLSAPSPGASSAASPAPSMSAVK